MEPTTIAVVLALTQVAKGFVKDTRWRPVLAMFFGILVLSLMEGFDLSVLLDGIIVGLIACGTFDGLKSGVKLGSSGVKAVFKNGKNSGIGTAE